MQEVLEKCPRGDDKKHGGQFRDLVSGCADLEPPPSAHAGPFLRDVALVWDLEESKVRLGGDTLGTVTCLETGGASLQVAKVAQLEPSALTGGSRQKTNRQNSRYDQLRASQQ